MKNLKCLAGQHTTGRVKQWVIDGNVVKGAYCQNCGIFVPEKKT